MECKIRDLIFTQSRVNISVTHPIARKPHKEERLVTIENIGYAIASRLDSIITKVYRKTGSKFGWISHYDVKTRTFTVTFCRVNIPVDLDDVVDTFLDWVYTDPRQTKELLES